jgi:hypothetical protein
VNIWCVLNGVSGRDRRVRGAFEATDQGEGDRPELPELDAAREPAEQRASLRWISAVPSAGTVAPGRPSRARRLPLTDTLNRIASIYTPTKNKN